MKSRDVWLVAAMLLLAAAFRLVALQDVPPGLSQDEVLNANIASGILEGRHALFFREGWGHEPLYHYLGALSLRLLGENHLSLRLPSVFCGMLVIALTFTVMRWAFGQWVARGAASVLCVNWWPIIFSRIGIRPVLEPLVLLLAVAFLWRGLFRGRRSGRWLGLSAVALGLTFYTYTAARILPLLFLIFFCYLGLFHQHTLRGRWHEIGIYCLLVLVVVSPLLFTVFTQPDLQQRVDQLRGPLEELSGGNPAPVFEATVRTLGVFAFAGDRRRSYGIAGRPLLEPFGAILFLIGLLVALRDWRRPEAFFALVWLCIGLIPSMVTPQSPSTIRMVGAMPVSFVFPVLALRAQGRRSPRTRRLRNWVLAGWLLVTAAWTIRDGFVRWPAQHGIRDKYQTIWLDIARDIRRNPAVSPVVADAWFDPLDNDTLRRNLGFDPDARWVQAGAAVIFPREAASRLYVPEYAPLSVDLTAIAGIPSEPLYRSDRTPSFAVYDLPAAPNVRAVASPVTFGNVATIVGYQLSYESVPRIVLLVTHWRVVATLPVDLAIFTHLLDANGVIVAQHDGLDVVSATLRVGDDFVQLHALPLPDSAGDGPYTLQVGLYGRGDGRRLTRPGDPADRLILVTDLAF